MPKRRTVRSDGKIYDRIDGDGKEIWLTPEQFEKREKTRKEYVNKCILSYKRRQQRKPAEERNFLGKYDPSRNLYFRGITSSGKEIWVTKQRLEEYRQKCNERRKNYNERCKQLPKIEGKIGDPHPSIPGLFIIFRAGNKLFYGDEVRLAAVRTSRARSYVKRNIKYRKKRKELLAGLQNKLSRGHQHPYDDLLFYEYNSHGREVWLPPDEFNKRREYDLARRRAKRLKDTKRE